MTNVEAVILSLSELDLKMMRICRRCWVAHAENCPSCFGFGLVRNSIVPLSAESAHCIFEGSTNERDWDRCGVCGGTPFGRSELPEPSYSYSWDFSEDAEVKESDYLYKTPGTYRVGKK